jgi:hypothetical protein
VSISREGDNERETSNRAIKAYRISRVALWVARDMMANGGLNRGEALATLRWAEPKYREAIRVRAGVKPATGKREGISTETWAQVLTLVERDL